MSVHVLPLADDREHAQALDCWCEPHVEWIDTETGLPRKEGGPMVIHNAADFRELAEGDGESLERGKEWQVVRV